MLFVWGRSSSGLAFALQADARHHAIVHRTPSLLWWAPPAATWCAFFVAEFQFHTPSNILCVFTNNAKAINATRCIPLSLCIRVKELRGVDTKALTRQELRNHLEARDLSTAGNKRHLAERLQESVLAEQASRSID